MIHELLPLMLAIGKYILASAVLLVFYRLFLRKNASFRESRLFLLSVAFLALAVSQFRIEVTHPAPTIVEVEREMPAAQQVPLLTVADGLSFPLQDGADEVTETAGLMTAGVGRISKETKVAVNTEPTMFQQVLTWIQSHLLQLLLSLYILVVLTLVINLLLQYRSIRKLRRTGMGSLHDGYTLVEHPEVSTPFSFATTIFLPSNLNAGQRDIVETHERWHIRHKHYVDVLVQEITCCMFWFNPIQWQLRKDLRSVHEYQADRSVLNEGCDVYRYQTVILEEVLGHHFRLANGFNQSFTKKRFIQMKQFEPLRLNTLRKVASVCFLVLLFAALSVVPGKSQVIRVERSSTSSRTENSSTTSVTTRSVDTLMSNLLSSSISIDPDASPSELQQSYALSLDSQQRMVNRILPIVRKLARSPHPADDVNDMNALLEAMKLQANKQVMSYSDFSAETKKSLTQQDFKDFEKTLMNMNDSIKLFRTYKVDRFDSPYLMKPLTLPLMFLSDKLMSVFLMESFSHAFGVMGGAMEMMGNTMNSMEGSIDKSPVKEVVEEDDLKGFGKALGELVVSMSQMESTLNKATPQTDKQTETPLERAQVDRQPTTRSSGSTVQRSVQNRSDNNEGPAASKTTISQLTDQTTLGNIARNDNDRDVRVEAILRLTDQNTLAYVARNDREPSVRKMAIQRLTDQNTLAYVARNDFERDVRVEAIIRLTDQNTLAHIARNDREPSVRKIAIRRLTDQNTLAYVARNDFERDVRVEAIIRLTDQNTLAYVARNDREPSVRRMAIQRLSDQNTLAYVARNDNDKDVQIEAIARMEQIDYQSTRRQPK